MPGLWKGVRSLSGSGEVVGAILILAGAVFSLISAIGNLRLPDVYTRSHAASKSSTLGVLCAMVGTLLYFIIAEGYFSIRLILGIFFVFLTAPVAAHVISRAAYRHCVPLAEETAQDELREYYQQDENFEGEDQVEPVEQETVLQSTS
ncbi:multisubunit sodium/proton antiporter, MrpG subunit (TC 2.A.63.1) [Paenibacillus barengoltzii J12]|uniref:Monovalent cation/proton antiporter, MnhG/PhaG subunit n=2 Tax=Paenibacillus barengoltzii TaxID=343517 RepID=R9L624_9BACL|nr:monovalent cation/proton antiporter, MnhG/PhaG subunit [Paenibacillus barengoltzii G22]SMF19544.1 multisubunit sodium/proton antiporter, MrpG subunit (TC 2.A.63.1) [Paenibacillus barengoltzii J12]